MKKIRNRCIIVIGTNLTSSMYFSQGRNTTKSTNKLANPRLALTTNTKNMVARICTIIDNYTKIFQAITQISNNRKYPCIIFNIATIFTWR